MIKGFPKTFIEATMDSKDGYPQYRRRNDGVIAFSKGVPVDNRNVVPYNKFLCSKFGAHINVEICNSVKAVKYLYKYVYKGHDKVIAEIKTQTYNLVMPTTTGSLTDPLTNVPTTTTDSKQTIDEISSYVDARYVSASESIWRILGFPLHDEYPKVFPLAIHLPDQQVVTFGPDDELSNVINKNMNTHLTSWFNTNQSDFNSRNLLYSEFPKHFTWEATKKIWKPRVRGESDCIGRIYFVQPGEGERYFLRMLLNIIKGATSFEDLRTVNNDLYPTFKEACLKLGLLEDDNEWIACLNQAVESQMPKELRNLFCTILLYCIPTQPGQLWTLFKQHMCEDFTHQKYIQAEAENLALIDIEKNLNNNSSSISNYPGIPMPHFNIIDKFKNSEIQNELEYCMEDLIKETDNVKFLNCEQAYAYHSIIDHIYNNNSNINMFFIDGPGGTGKTYLYNTLLSTVRRNGDIALAVASSGIAALLLVGGRTAHSRLKIPIKLDELAVCNIKKNSNLSELLKITKLIIWDEAPMTHKHAFEAIDRSLRDILGNKKIFGGITICLGGDFRQILPVIKHGSRSDIVQASLKRSYLWNNNVTIFKLRINMRVLQLQGNTNYYLLHYL